GYRGPEARHPDLADEQLVSAIRNLPSLGGLRPAIVSAVGDDSVSIVLRNGDSGTIAWDNMRWARPYLSANSMGPNPRKPADVLQRGDVIRVQPLEESGQYRLTQLPEAQSALVSLSPQDGSIQALTGGFSFVQSNYNRVTQARRQPGSAFKPFLYAAALDRGYTPASLINDAPLVFNDGHQAEDWRPRNAGGDFLGPIRLREALYRSRNLVSVRLMMDIGVDEALSYIERFGFNRSDLPRHLSASLGTPELTPLQIATGYAVIANGGYAVKPWLIERIENSERQVIDFGRPAVAPEAVAVHQRRILAYVGLDAPTSSTQVQTAEQVIDPRTIYQLNSMLQDVITRGTASRARELQRSDLAGKTGTTNDQKDGWFSGYNGDYVTTVWVGFDQPAPLGRREYGSTTALPIWSQFMAAALAGRPEHSQPQPEGLVSVRIDPYTGRTARPGTPGALLEIFKEEDMPPSYSELEIGGYISEDALTPLELF
ncbi:MAG: peptidase, partial [Pseudomonas formosensis]|nr:peptidase [Halopseudomonas formosensis]